MARFLVTVWPFSGHIHPNLAVARALRARGHEVAFYTGHQAQPLAEREGFRVFPFARVDADRVEHLVLSIGRLSLERMRVLSVKRLMQEWLLDTIPAQLDDLEPVLAAWPPDTVICDPAMWAPILVLHESRDLPVAVLSYVAACMIPGRYGPTLGMPLPPPRTWATRFVGRLVRAFGALAAQEMPRAASRVRQAHGLPPLRCSVTEFTAQMPLYLVPSTPEFDYGRRDLPPSVRYVGPCTWQKAATEPAPEWLAALSHDRPLVYVTEGTTHVQEPIVLQAALRGLADLPAHVVMTTGTHRDPAQLALGPVPPNVRLERWVPHSDLLPRADVVVTTGGSGTVLATIQEGTPLVIVPTAWDQPENAWRVATAGAGLRLPAHRCTPERLRHAVQQVLREPAFRLNARRLATSFARYGGATQAAGLLQELALRQAA